MLTSEQLEAATKKRPSQRTAEEQAAVEARSLGQSYAGGARAYDSDGNLISVIATGEDYVSETSE